MRGMQIANWMDTPPLSHQREDRQANLANAYSGIRNRMLEGDMREMQLSQEQEKRDLLKNFEGGFDTPEFRDAAMRVDPKMADKISQRLDKIDERQREEIGRRMTALSSKALLDDTEEKWNASNWPVPYSKRDDIITQGTTYAEALNTWKARQPGAGGQGTALMRNTDWLVRRGFDERAAIDLLTRSKEETPQKFEQDVFQQVLREGIVTSVEDAEKMAREAREIYYPNQTPARVTGNFQSSAGPSRSGQDFSNLWK